MHATPNRQRGNVSAVVLICKFLCMYLVILSTFSYMCCFISCTLEKCSFKSLAQLN